VNVTEFVFRFLPSLLLSWVFLWFALSEHGKRQALERELEAVNALLQEALHNVDVSERLHDETERKLVIAKNQVEELLLQFNFQGEPWTIG
jgi:hypothetical protein